MSKFCFALMLLSLMSCGVSANAGIVDCSCFIKCEECVAGNVCLDCTSIASQSIDLSTGTVGWKAFYLHEEKAEFDDLFNSVLPFTPPLGVTSFKTSDSSPTWIKPPDEYDNRVGAYAFQIAFDSICGQRLSISSFSSNVELLFVSLDGVLISEHVDPIDDIELVEEGNYLISFFVFKDANSNAPASLAADVKLLGMTMSTTPEPASVSLFALGLLGLGVYTRSRKP